MTMTIYEKGKPPYRIRGYLLTGKSPDYEVLFNSDTQEYTVYYKNQLLIGKKYKRSDIQQYLN